MLPVTPENEKAPGTDPEARELKYSQRRLWYHRPLVKSVSATADHKKISKGY